MGFDRRERRRRAAEKGFLPGLDLPAPPLDDEAGRTDLHDERLGTVLDVLRESGARTVLDLGCGSGALLRRLIAEPRFTRIVGVDSALEAFTLAERMIAEAGEAGGERVSLEHGSLTAVDRRLAGFDAVTMVEVIEHVRPRELSAVEGAVFAGLAARTVVMTTPNREYNVLYGNAEGEFRRADHHFEWTRAELRAWCSGVAGRNGYSVAFRDIGPPDPRLGSPTQMAIFRALAD